MGDTKTIILEHVFPAIGVVLATQMFMAPFRDVQEAIRAGSLGELNPLPWIFMLGNCTGWVYYSFLTRNFYIFAGNIPGLVLSIWFNLSASNLLFKQQVAQLPDVINVVDQEEYSGDTKDTKRFNPNGLERTTSHTSDDNAIPLTTIAEGNEDMRSSMMLNNTKRPSYATMAEINGADKGDVEAGRYAGPDTAILPPPITELPVFYTAPVHDYRVMAMCVLWLAIFSVLGFGESIHQNEKELIVGVVTNLCLVFFYGAPLSCIAIIVRTHNTATLHVPTMLTNTASSFFWGIYGLATLNLFVAVPNVLGALLGFVQIFLYLTYPRLETKTVPVITAAVPAPGAAVFDGNAPAEMEIVQMQLYHDVGAADFLGQAGMIGNTNAGDAVHNPMNMAYVSSIPDGEYGCDDSNVTTLHKQELTLDRPLGELTTGNPLVLQLDDTGTENANPNLDLGSSIANFGLTHRRTNSRNTSGVQALTHTFNGAIESEPAQAATQEYSAPPTSATVASVHHKRVISNTDTSFFAGLFASDNDLLHLETTTTATLHRRVLSNSNADVTSSPNRHRRVLSNSGQDVTATLHRRVLSNSSARRED